MISSAEMTLSLTQISDLDFVIETEQLFDNKAYISQWTRGEHINTIERNDREHWLIASSVTGEKLGYLISFDLTQQNCGTYIKRIALNNKGQGIGRKAIALFLQHTFLSMSPYVWLCVYPENIRGQRCYQALGFSSLVSSSIPSLAEKERHVRIAENAPIDNFILMHIAKSSYERLIA
ncbi:GNAT family N-acetyltransferase [uncultured Shewanella sp.]|uniref:GNAT family N-acetyltransferase n=1 Tax=uncultured Shewanella sp. TaxID=173975 RepID=UPI002603E6FF|nr:GNAT family N-acetyltransferase [uncultured Shewanella sp.]